MNAVAEEPVQVQAPPFTMPKPARGQPILWFPDANRHAIPEVGFVREIGHSSLVIYVGGVPLDSVRHIDDPRLKQNAHQRENGAWDFPESERDMITLRERVDKLEALVIQLQEDTRPEPTKTLPKHWKTIEKEQREAAEAAGKTE
jgi:hypothetical protein